jgi:Legionella pneumophila major outer membrane protein precursor
MRDKVIKTGLIAAGLLMHLMSFANPAYASSLLTQSAQNDSLLTSTENPSSMQQKNAALERRRGGMVNPPARPLVEDFDVNLFGDLLIWQAHQNNLPIAIKNKATNFTSTSGYQNFQEATVKHLHHNYDTGLRLGVDFDTMYDGWDVCLTWLSFDADADKSVFASGNQELFPSRLNLLIAPFIADSDDFAVTPAPVYGKAHARWKSFLNQIDFDLGREFFVSRRLTLRPHFGLRTTWIRQHLKTEYSDGIIIIGRPTMSDTSVKEKNKWWGIGLEGGLDASWMLGEEFSLYANLAAAIESGFQKVKVSQEIESTDTTFEDLKDSYRISRPILDLQLGLKWDRMLANGSYNFGFHFGWEHHVYFSQNQFHAQESLGPIVANQGDLTYQGWTLGAHLAF